MDQLRNYLILFLLIYCKGFASSFVFDPLYESVQQTRIDQINSTEGIKIFWWNIACYINGSRNPYADINISELAKSNFAPDLIILGEYHEGRLSVSTKNILNQYYPYKLFIPHTRMPGLGNIIFSKLAFQNSLNNLSELDWLPPNWGYFSRLYYYNYWKQVNPEADDFYRGFQWVNVVKNNSIFNIVPVHFLQPWSYFIEQYGDAGVPEMIQKILVGLQIQIGTINPLMNQIYYFKNKLIHNNLIHRTIIIGDHNFQRFLLPAFPTLPTSPYLRMSEGLKDAFPHNSPITFPTHSAGNQDLQFKIDHAFSTIDLTAKKSFVLNFTGSDHYPVYVVY